MTDVRIKPHRGAMILIFGILGIVVCGPLSIVAWIMGSGDLKEIAAGRMDPEGQSSTYAGWILGVIGTVLNIIIIVAVVVLVGLAVVLSVFVRAGSGLLLVM